MCLWLCRGHGGHLVPFSCSCFAGEMPNVSAGTQTLGLWRGRVLLTWVISPDPQKIILANGTEHFKITVFVFNGPFPLYTARTLSLWAAMKHRNKLTTLNEVSLKIYGFLIKNKMKTQPKLPGNNFKQRNTDLGVSTKLQKKFTNIVGLEKHPGPLYPTVNLGF